MDVKEKNKRKRGIVLGFIVVLSLGIWGISFYQTKQNRKHVQALDGTTWKGQLGNKKITVDFFRPPPKLGEEDYDGNTAIAIRMKYQGKTETLNGKMERGELTLYSDYFENITPSKENPRHALRGNISKDGTLINGQYGIYIDKNFSEYLDTGEWKISKQ